MYTRKTTSRLGQWDIEGHDTKIVPCTSKLVIKKSRVPGGGYGVFSLKDFAAGDTVEIIPHIKIPKHLISNATILNKYVVKYNGDVLIMLGYGSMYNHSPNPNVSHGKHDKDPNRFIRFYATRPIKRGEELFINYGRHHGKINA